MDTHKIANSWEIYIRSIIYLPWIYQDLSTKYKDHLVSMQDMQWIPLAFHFLDLFLDVSNSFVAIFEHHGIVFSFQRCYIDLYSFFLIRGGLLNKEAEMYLDERLFKNKHWFHHSKTCNSHWFIKKMVLQGKKIMLALIAQQQQHQKKLSSSKRLTFVFGNGKVFCSSLPPQKN